MKEHQNTPEELNLVPGRGFESSAEQALEAVAERVLGESPRREVDGLRFDWEPLALSEPNLVIFSAEVHCRDERARVRFGIDLAKLQTPELEELHNILARRHTGLDDRQSLLRSIEWMLTISLGQTEPGLTKDERKDRAQRALLLIPPVG